jgi:hypothetical protein
MSRELTRAHASRDLYATGRFVPSIGLVLSVKKPTLTLTLIGLLVLFLVSVFAAPYAHATIPESITYYLNGAVSSCDLQPPLSTTLSTTQAVGSQHMEGPNLFICVDEWPVAGRYAGPAFTITSVVFTVFICCGNPPTLGVDSGASLYHEDDSTYMFSSGSTEEDTPALSSTSCASATELSYPLAPLSSSEQLQPGQSYELITSVGGGGTTGGGFADVCTGGSTPSSFTVSGFIQIPVPEFPFGLFVVVALALPGLFILRARILK